MLIHPDVHLEIARQRHHDLLADGRLHGIRRGRDDLTGPSSARATRRTGTSRATRSSRADWGCEGVLTATDHFGHRETGGLVVDLFWNPRNLAREFRVEVEDEREGTRLVLHPRTGREAIQAFHHPFAAAPAPAEGPVIRACREGKETGNRQ